ncbi:MAG TPA: hypothetical protein VF133_18415 [Terriglobales bacterium]
MSRLRRVAICLAAILVFSAASLAATLNGAVTNGTSGKPSAGDEAILIKLGAGMEEVAHAKTDAQGKFSFNFDDANSPHLVRIVHQGVTYHQMAPPGTNSLDVSVYDVAQKVEGVRAVADLMFIQAAQGTLNITRIFSVSNNSKPARTQMNDANFEFNVPQAAQIDEASAQTPGGQPLNLSPTPQAQKGRYAFVFPLRPGETQFQLTYHMPYSGKTTIDPQLIYPLQHFVAIVPRAMTFSPAQQGIYEAKQPPNQPEAVAELADNPQPGQRLAFDVSGNGLLRNEEEQASGGAAGGASTEARPGGGIGAPIDAPDPLDNYRYYILGGFGIVLVAGAIYTVNRSRSSQASPQLAVAATSGPALSGSGNLLQVLKDELFQLEMERQQGQLSEEEYLKTKAALDQTLARAIKRTREN